MDISYETSVRTLQSFIGKTAFWVDDLEVKQGVVTDVIVARSLIQVRIPLATDKRFLAFEPHKIYLKHEEALAALLKKFQTKVAELERALGK